LEAAPRLARLELHWLRDFDLPQGLPLDALTDLLADGAQPPPYAPPPPHAHAHAAMPLPPAPAHANVAAAVHAALLLPQAGVPPDAPAVDAFVAACDARPGELDACLLAIARVAAAAAAAAAAADGAALGADAASGAAAAARPLALHCCAPEKLSAAGVAAARGVYPALTLSPMAADGEEEEWEKDEYWDC
jgi:hypothetical protein